MGVQGYTWRVALSRASSRGGGVPTTEKVTTAVACRFPTASPVPQFRNPSPELTLTRLHQRFVHAHPPGLPLTCDRLMGRQPLGLNPKLRTPPLPATHVGAGTGAWLTSSSSLEVHPGTGHQRHGKARRGGTARRRDDHRGSRPCASVTPIATAPPVPHGPSRRSCVRRLLPT
jgi:hypothetical protein